jgi:hypothetical protein
MYPPVCLRQEMESSWVVFPSPYLRRLQSLALICRRRCTVYYYNERLIGRACPWQWSAAGILIQKQCMQMQRRRSSGFCMVGWLDVDITVDSLSQRSNKITTLTRPVLLQSSSSPKSGCTCCCGLEEAGRGSSPGPRLLGWDANGGAVPLPAWKLRRPAKSGQYKWR